MSGKHPLEALAEYIPLVDLRDEGKVAMSRAYQLEIQVTPRIDLKDKDLTKQELEVAWKEAPPKVKARVDISRLTQQVSEGQLCNAELEQAIKGLATSRKTLLREKKPGFPGWEPLETMGGAILAEPLESAREKQEELRPLAELMGFFTDMQVQHNPDSIVEARDNIVSASKDSLFMGNKFSLVASGLRRNPELLELGAELWAGYANYFRHGDRSPAAMAAVALNHLGWPVVNRSHDYFKASQSVWSNRDPYRPAMLIKVKTETHEFQPEALATADNYYSRMIALYVKANYEEAFPIWQAAGTLKEYQSLFPDCDEATIAYLNQRPKPLSVTSASGIASKELLGLKPEVTVKLNELTGLSALMHSLGEII